jgi:hypothetical protein
MGRIRIIAVLGMLVVLSYSSCTDSSSDKPVADVDTILTDTSTQETPTDTVVINNNTTKLYSLTQDDKNILELLQTVEMGFSFNEVKAKYPSVKGIRPEDKKDDLAAAGFTESVCKQAVFGGEASAEFNFKDDSLYSYVFTYNDKDHEKADQVFQAIKKYYSNKWGDAQPEMVEEENHYNQNFIWTGQSSIVPYLNFNVNTNTIVWGRRYEKTL